MAVVNENMKLFVSIQFFSIATFQFCKMADVSEYTIEYRMLASTWWHESSRNKAALKNVRAQLAERFAGEVPNGRVIKEWEGKLFTTGSLLDKPIGGRPSASGDIIPDLEASLAEAPQKSVKQRASDLNIPKSSLHRMIHKEGYKPFKPTFTQFLSEEDEDIRLTACGQLMNKYPTAFTQRNIFFSDECAVYADGSMENIVYCSKENPHFQN